jgi:photosystem II stability/assembly factor-like uncharacterized protein
MTALFRLQIIFLPSNYIFAGTEEGGVFRALADDGMPEWILLGLDSIPITALTVQHWGAGPVDGLTLYAGVEPDYEHGDSTSILRREVKLSLGTSWVVADSGIDKSEGGVFTLNSYYYTGHTPPGKLLAGGKSGIYYEGNNIWTQPEIETENPYILAIDVAPHWWGNLAWAAGHYGLAPNVAPLVLLSTDQGITWKQFALADYLSTSATSVAINTRNTDSIYVSCNHYIFLTPDSGSTWEDVFSSRGVLFKKLALDPLHPENVFAGGLFFDDSHQSPNHGVFLHSKNGGKDWHYAAPIVDTLLKEITSIAVFRKPDDSCGYVFIGTAGTGVWVYKYSTITGIIEEKNIPEQFSLIQNYPNPFNPSTSIKFSLPNAGRVQLKIYNLLGKEVSELINEEKPAGNYEIKFDGSKLPSGVYFYTISAGNFRQTKKMILAK